MVDVKTEIVINKNIELVSEYASNPDNAPEWYVNILSSEWITEKPLKIGSQIAFNARFMGKDLSYTYEIKEYNKGKKLTMKTAEGPFPMSTTYEWEEISPDKTLMKLRNHGQPKGFSKLFSPFMSMMMRKANNKDLQSIKAILESRIS